MNDIVDELRNVECDCPCRVPIEARAADEIERLRAELVEAKELLRYALDDVGLAPIRTFLRGESDEG